MEKILRRFILPDANCSMNWSKWELYDERIKSSFPIRWFISETLPNFYRRKIVNRWHKTRNWVRYRTTDRYHVVKLEIKPGYTDPCNRLLEANFQILKDFVEIELASMQLACDSPSKSDTRLGVLDHFKDIFNKARRKNIRNPEAGLRYLNWEIEESGGRQAVNAAEKKALYLWWTIDRPNRFKLYEDPHLGWSRQGDVLVKGDNADYQMIHSLEDFYIKQDQEMLLRLVKIYSSLWI